MTRSLSFRLILQNPYDKHVYHEIEKFFVVDPQPH